MKHLHAFLAAIALLFAASAARADDAADIRALLHGMFDKPDAELVIDPVVVEDGFAIAGWVQGPTGGRAFLRSHDGRWMLVLCAGDEIRSAKALAESGVPVATAEALAAAVAEAEKAVPQETLAQFASFGGIVMMDDHAAHK